MHFVVDTTGSKKFIGLLALLLLLSVSCTKSEDTRKTTIRQSFDKSATVFFGGDTAWGENYSKPVMKMLNKHGYAHPIEKVGPLMAASDVVILNLETVLTDLRESPYEHNKPYVHWSDVKKVPEQLLKNGVDAVSLANNHTIDFAEQGLYQTIDILNKNDILWVGAGKDLEEARKPLFIELTIGGKQFRMAVLAAFKFRSSYERRFKAYAMESRPGTNRLSGKKMASQIQKLKAEDPDLFVVVFPHWGANYKWISKKQAKHARHYIDAGADMVIGHGAHAMQEIEKYKDGWILYSIGNFVFNSPGRYKHEKAPPYSLPTRITIEKKGENLVPAIRLYPILSDNLRTNYQPRPLNQEEFDDACRILRERYKSPEAFDKDVVKAEDDLGLYLRLQL